MSNDVNDPSNRVSTRAVFRYMVVSQVLARQRRGEVRSVAVAVVARMGHAVSGTGLRRVSERTIYRWLSAFEQRGLSGLEPRLRSAARVSVCLPDSFINFLKEQKRADPRVSIPEVIRRARGQGILSDKDRIDRSTVFRVCKRLDLPVRRRKPQKDQDTRRFEYPHRMQMVLCDGKHFRAGVARRKRVALFFLDDATRFVLNVIVGTSENTTLFLTGLYQAIRRYGLMSALYLDRGSGFRSDDTKAAVGKLGALLIQGCAGYPQGHGKIERFNRTALSDALRGYDGNPAVDAGPGALNLRLQHYLDHHYNRRVHESLKGQTPRERFSGDSRALRFPPSDDQLRQWFTVQLDRRVSNDHVVSVDGRAYEVPAGHAGERVILDRHLLTGMLIMLHRGRMVELSECDLAANAVSRRGAASQPLAEAEDLLPPSAADLSFQQDFRSIIEADGGYRDPEQPHTEEDSDGSECNS